MKIDIEEVVRSYGDMVLRLAVANTADPVAAEDIFQEVFLKLFGSLNCFKDEGHLKAWLIRVTVNMSHNYVKSYWNTHTDGFSKESEMADHRVEKILSDMEEGSDVTRVVMGLPAGYKEIVHLFYFEELTVKEIAAIMGEKVATVKTRLGRARSMLQERLGEAYSL